jgi:hypothetical protein
LFARQRATGSVLGTCSATRCARLYHLWFFVFSFVTIEFTNSFKFN